ncbi:MAG TPA: proliferating cell nuclear antigen (pcna) [Candidatus Methanofastidiosa archaeon]|nr:proliferating cell nuclear antigen (pcna) [Candidatus Methanofastidiosa archaeon]HPR41668.1 proliferating cell nuclear antigen (pcna) [Candidatus Methanofastidiosa archaeon]
MIEASVLDSRKIKYILESIAEIVDEASFVFDETSFRINGADPSIISKVEVYLNKDFFNEYYVEEPSEMGVDMSSLDKIAKRILFNDKFTIKSRANENSLELILDGDIQRKFDASLIDISNNLPKISLEFPVMVEIDAETFKNSIKDLAVIGGSVIFDASPGQMIMSSIGETGNAVVTIKNVNGTVKEMLVNKSCSARYNISYLMSFLKAGQISDTIKIFFGDKDLPLKLEFVFDNGNMMFYLAPMEY